jgi:peptidoglycan biosynthesis protein MviN/MurJ (putative lipid II flippase)
MGETPQYQIKKATLIGMIMVRIFIPIFFAVEKTGTAMRATTAGRIA